MKAAATLLSVAALGAVAGCSSYDFQVGDHVRVTGSGRVIRY